MHRFWPALTQTLALALLTSWGAGAVGAAESTNEALTILLDQNAALQSEVQALRALVEEQGFEIRKLQRESLDRYTDLDSRLGALEQTRPSGTAANSSNPMPGSNAAVVNANPIGTSPPLTTTATPPADEATQSGASAAGNSAVPNGLVSTEPAGNSSRPSLQPAVLSEQELYQLAYESAINSQFERAIAEFDQYLSIYPTGRFTTNAYYWKGQSYLYLSRFQEAVDSYEVILQQYPDAAKIPDALYGLGVAYEGLGNIPRARQLMQEIKRRFPNTGVANLADTRLLSLD